MYASSLHIKALHFFTTCTLFCSILAVNYLTLFVIVKFH